MKSSGQVGVAFSSLAFINNSMAVERHPASNYRARILAYDADHR